MENNEEEIIKVCKRHYLYIMSDRGIDDDFCHYMNNYGIMELPREMVHDTFTKWINEWVAMFNRLNTEYPIMLINEDPMRLYIFTKCFKNTIFEKNKLCFPDANDFVDEVCLLYETNLGNLYDGTSRTKPMILYGSIVECAIMENDDDTEICDEV
jgi:hypothetical protein